MDNQLLLSWDTFLSLSNRLLAKLPKNHFDMVVCINSGGLVLGKLTKDYLSAPLAVITAKAYDTSTTKCQSTGIALGSVSTIEPIKGNILIVDDLVDKGLTMHTVFWHFKDYEEVKEISTCSIFKKPGSTFTPTYFVEETDKWIIFPYELNEFINHD
jgi:uncharacterized protein